MAESEDEVEFWNQEAKKTRAIIQRGTKESLRRDILTNSYWWEESQSKMKNKVILDIGCGTTDHTAYWELTGNETYGIDISLEQIRNEVMLHQKIGVNGRFIVSSFTNMPFQDSLFDVLSMHWVFHHIPKTQLSQSLQDAHRILKKNGIFLLYENNYFYPFRWIVQTNFLAPINFLRKIAIKKRLLDPREKAYSNREYLNLLEKNGFRIRKVDFSNDFLIYPPTLLFQNKKLLQIISRIDLMLKHIIPTVLKDGVSIIARK